MKKRKIFIICIDIIFWASFIFFAIKEVGVNFSDEFDINMLKTLQMHQFLAILVGIVCALLMIMTVFILKKLWLVIIYVVIRVSFKNRNKQKLEKIDFKNDSYYRDVIKKYSPGVLSYIDDYNLDEKDIVATLLDLKLKNKIKINDEIEIISTIDEELDENEKYILQKIKEKNININEFEKYVILDCQKHNLLINEDIEDKIYKRKRLFIIAYIIIAILYFLPFLDYYYMLPIYILSTCAVAFLPVNVILAFFCFKALRINMYENPYIRNKKSKEINIKLEGLKNYIKDYSLLNEKTSDDITVWEDYLIYSVMFGQNDEVVNEIMSKVNGDDR